jgi:hypothetical protein
MAGQDGAMREGLHVTRSRAGRVPEGLRDVVGKRLSKIEPRRERVVERRFGEPLKQASSLFAAALHAIGQRLESATQVLPWRADGRGGYARAVPLRRASNSGTRMCTYRWSRPRLQPERI